MNPIRVTNRIRDLDLDPILTSTQRELAFAAWTCAQRGVSNVADSQLMREAFEGWWNGRDFSYFANLRQLARAAWNFSSNLTESQATSNDDCEAFEAFWGEIVAAGKRIAIGGSTP